jgi:hypothetical protein
MKFDSKEQEEENEYELNSNTTHIQMETSQYLICSDVVSCRLYCANDLDDKSTSNVSGNLLNERKYYHISSTTKYVPNLHAVTRYTFFTAT